MQPGPINSDAINRKLLGQNGRPFAWAFFGEKSHVITPDIQHKHFYRLCYLSALITGENNIIHLRYLLRTANAFTLLTKGCVNWKHIPVDKNYLILHVENSKILKRRNEDLKCHNGIASNYPRVIPTEAGMYLLLKWILKTLCHQRELNPSISYPGQSTLTTEH